MSMTYDVNDFVASTHGAHISSSPPGKSYRVQTLSARTQPEPQHFVDVAGAIFAVPKAEADAEEAKLPKRARKTA
jgi:hypothetical protein